MELPWFRCWVLLLLASTSCASNILMVTMGGTKSHKIPFLELARGLIRKGHNITLISPFTADFHMEGMEEITPEGLASFIRGYMSLDLVGARMRGEEPLPYMDIIRYGYEACEAFLEDVETRSFLRSAKNYDLAILDGAYPECALGVVHKLKTPFMYINTVSFYTSPTSISGSPAPYSVTPFFARSFTDNMGFLGRSVNSFWQLSLSLGHVISMTILQSYLRQYFGGDIPHVYDMAKNVSFVLQNGHHSVTYPRPFLPNVAEIACIHCKESKRLNADLEEWISGAGEDGFVYVSMGSSVKTNKMPLAAHRLFVNALARLPQRVLWKQDGEQNMTNIPSNIRIYKWLPQQDLLGHPKIKAFVTHGGLLSMFETVYHGVPVVSIPVFCDHDANAAKAEVDGYAKKLDLQNLTPGKLYRAIKEVINVPRYKSNVDNRRVLLRDQKETPLERAIYWTEYVLRHKGAYHLQSPAKDLNFFQYYLIDVVLALVIASVTLMLLTTYTMRKALLWLVDLQNRKTNFISKSQFGLFKSSQVIVRDSLKEKVKLS